MSNLPVLTNYQGYSSKRAHMHLLIPSLEGELWSTTNNLNTRVPTSKAIKKAQ
ncbi:MAG: hypothetical protein RID18_11680 [Cytophagales bacterium]